MTIICAQFSKETEMPGGLICTKTEQKGEGWSLNAQLHNAHRHTFFYRSSCACKNLFRK